MAHLNGEVFHWKKLPMVEVDCPQCDANDAELYERFGEELQYSYVKCRECEFIYQSPRFEYNDEFLRWAYSWYGDSFIEDTKNGVSLDDLIASDISYFHHKKELIDRYHRGGAPYRLLDVGCACGQFLHFCHQNGCVVTGVETSASQVEFIRKNCQFEIILGTPADIRGRDNSFDVVHIAHTLEHVPQPRHFLIDLIRLLRPGGLLFVEVPNVVSLKNYSNHLFSRWGIRKNTWKKGDFPEHLIEFTPRSLQRTLHSLELDIVHFQVHSRSALGRSTLSSSLDLKLNHFLPIGDNLICLGRKRVDC